MRIALFVCLLTSFSLVGSAHAQLAMPQDYWSRFGMFSVLASQNTGYGVRFLPLPIQPDIRLLFAKRPKYWEYALYTRQNDTTFMVGVMDNGDNADKGRPKLEISHDPWLGVHFGGVIQSPGNASYFTAGYAFMLGDVRLLNNLGVAFQNDQLIPYIKTQASYYKDFTIDNLKLELPLLGILHTFPNTSQYQMHIELKPAFEYRYKPFSVRVGQVSNFVFGGSAVPDFGGGSWHATDFALSYKLPAVSPSFPLNTLRTRLHKHWTDQKTVVNADFLFTIDVLPILIGPSLGYQENGKNPDASRWFVTFSTAPR